MKATAEFTLIEFIAYMVLAFLWGLTIGNL